MVCFGDEIPFVIAILASSYRELCQRCISENNIASHQCVVTRCVFDKLSCVFLWMCCKKFTLLSLRVFAVGWPEKEFLRGRFVAIFLIFFHRCLTFLSLFQISDLCAELTLLWS